MDITKRNSAQNVKPQYIAAPTVPTIQITHTTTDNLFGGAEPWPPDGNAFWIAVGSTAPGTTKWRHIGLGIDHG